MSPKSQALPFLFLHLLELFVFILFSLRLDQEVLKLSLRCLPDELLHLEDQPVEVVLISQVDAMVLLLEEGVLHRDQQTFPVSLLVSARLGDSRISA